MLLELKNINFKYNEGKQVLDNLSLTLEDSKIYALMGTNGAGKTTLFNIVTGFIKHQKGEVIFNNKNISHYLPHRRNQIGIGRTFQDLRIITKLTVKENVILAMRSNPTENWIYSMLPKGFFNNETTKIENKAEQLLIQFFLKDVINSKADDISYGQQKLLTLACCVANGSKLLLLDEPVAGVQPEYRNKIVTLLKEIKNKGRTILMIEHNTDFISEVADKIFFMNEGCISEYDSVDRLKSDSRVMETYM